LEALLEPRAARRNDNAILASNECGAATSLCGKCLSTRGDLLLTKEWNGKPGIAQDPARSERAGANVRFDTNSVQDIS
jgi:hypothetical protein